MAATPTSALRGETTLQELTRNEQAIARRTAETRATVPDLEFAAELDAAPALAAAQRAGGALTAVLVSACGRALRAQPRANAAYRDGRYELYSRVNVAVTVATDAGLVSPTVLDADTKTLPELAAELAGLTERARTGALTPPEQAGATFTLLPYGSALVQRPGALIVGGQAAALACGAPRPAPVLRSGEVVAGHLLGLTLACDARILFGDHAVALLEAIAAELADVGSAAAAHH